MTKKWTFWKVVLVVWVVFSILYVGYTQYRYFQSFIADRAYQKGLQDAVVEVIKQAQNCEPFPITIGDQGVQLINVACLQAPEGGESAE